MSENTPLTAEASFPQLLGSNYRKVDVPSLNMCVCVCICASTQSLINSLSRFSYIYKSLG